MANFLLFCDDIRSQNLASNKPEIRNNMNLKLTDTKKKSTFHHRKLKNNKHCLISISMLLTHSKIGWGFLHFILPKSVLRSDISSSHLSTFCSANKARTLPLEIVRDIKIASQLHKILPIHFALVKCRETKLYDSIKNLNYFKRLFCVSFLPFSYIQSSSLPCLCLFC